jgi:hypothetical protein
MSRTIFHRALYVVLALLTAPLAASDGDSVALITDLQGEARLVDAKAPALSILSELRSGSALRLAAGARASLIYLESGQEFTLAGPAEVSIGDSAPAAITGAPPSARGVALARGGGVRIKPVSVTQASIVMRAVNAPQKLRLLGLAGGQTLSAAPRFAWQAPVQGLEYRFELFDATGQSLHSATTRETALDLPATVALVPGVNYSWLVSGRLDGKSWSNAGDFTVADDTLRARAEALRPADDALMSERVVYAAWLEQNQLRDEARAWWKQMASERDQDPALKVLAGE